MTHSGWFSTTKLEDRTYLIGEPPHVNSYLIMGSRRAILFDTGLGIASIRSVVEELTELDMLVVNSHYHFDHIGGNSEFSDIAIHELGAKPMGEEVSAEWLAAYGEFTSQMLESFRVYREADGRFFHLLTPDLNPRNLPAGFSFETWRIPPSVPTSVLNDGDVLDLGNRNLRVIHTPGHTPDCICLLDEASGALFAGDTLTTGPHYAHMPDSSLADFTMSTRRLAGEVSQSISAVYPAHILRYGVSRQFVIDVADGFARVSDGTATPVVGIDIFGESVAEYWFDGFSVVLPGPGALDT
jgi:glyoxylase-like metal-dependent hydrolase (beta-lactamase superfamily II)